MKKANELTEAATQQMKQAQAVTQQLQQQMMQSAMQGAQIDSQPILAENLAAATSIDNGIF